MKFIGFSAGIMTLALSTSALAFMPTNGLWQIDSESTTGALGRGITLEVENEVLVFTYYGYRADASSLFYVATGPIANNSFSGDLLSVQGGTSMGGEYKPGSLATSPGKVTLNFSSGKSGTMTLPGESPKAISKFSYGYSNGPDGLFGTWILTSTINSSTYATRQVINRKLGSSTSSGNGIVTNSADSFRCEYQVSGALSGTVACANLKSSVTDGFFFKFSGDRGTGANIYGASGAEREYESHAIRIASKSGTATGLNNGTLSTASIRSVPTTGTVSTNADKTTEQSKASANAVSISPLPDPEKVAAFAAWKAEMGALSMPKN